MSGVYYHVLSDLAYEMYIYIYNMHSLSLSLFFISSWFKDDMWSMVTPSLLEGRPNTYTYSKSLGEQIIMEEAHDLPVAILRPSIIGAAVKDPLPVSEGGRERMVIISDECSHV